MNDETAITIYTGGDQGATSYVAAVAREWLNTRPVSWATFNQRRSILSSFFKYALRNEVEHIQANPIERIKARRSGEKAAAAQALHPGAIKTALAAIDRSTAQGLLWLSFSDRNFSQAIGPRTISNVCERHLGTGKVHTTRHTAAVNLSHQKGVKGIRIHGSSS